MIINADEVKNIYVSTHFVDMRKSIDGLTLIVHSQFQMNVLDHSLFIFTNRSRNRIKILYYESNGFWLFIKRLEHGKFKIQESQESLTRAITYRQLSWLLEGLEYDEKMKEKIGLFCNVKKEHVLQNLDAPSLYEVPIMMEEEHLAQAVCECLNLPCPEPNLEDWKKMLEDLHHPTSSVTIALVGKYVALHDAYLSVAEALKHGGIANRAQVNIRWIDAEELTPENLEEYLHDVDGILVPGGFGQRGTEGKILAIGYARRNKIPYLGLCLGMQLTIVEFARNVLGYADAHSKE